MNEQQLKALMRENVETRGRYGPMDDAIELEPYCNKNKLSHYFHTEKRARTPEDHEYNVRQRKYIKL